ncbi:MULTISPECIES: Na+/H+ antiporter subunit C [Thauera]|uniref:Na+/H+ antiporter subunit C n=1 Tax=unclassified Thauera TaxID=2609274 RepID=UPI0002D0C9FD|nr:MULTISPECIES: Na+/H+ antiporter subunit C [Thauera]ENO75570.1 NADH-ubiquinone oxidoreductase chain 4L [Thauera sp. 27]ENO91206.1 NADH-ubiquinone oxidoreductase chain 4L [Thauera sp. 28]MDG3065508.1 Na+/H+ antiporter subunit C [Thauera mechernichensis]WBL65128.1 Na+/H+ antiporter subunit C [Thauera sp. WB-2]HAY08972.1 Na+/H+ antiporter subunit C [Thauera sp.]
MEFLVATAIGAMTAAGVYLVLRARTFPVIIGLTLLTYATNLFLFATGRLAVNLPPVISADAAAYTDPLPQALVLTAIVISFGMTAVIVVMSLRAYLETGNDHVDLPGDASPEAREDDWKLLGRKQGEPAARAAAGLEERA